MTDRSRFGPGYLMPPVSFPVYGLDGSFTGARWLGLFGDPPDGAPTWMTLNHQSADGRSLINVTTFVRRAAGNPRSWSVPTDAQAAEQGRSPLEDVARQGAVALTSLTLPALSLTRPPGFLKALVDQAEAATSAYRNWPQASWRVDGEPVQVPVWRFAGGWTAFTDVAAGVYLSVAGVGPDTGPEDLGLAAAAGRPRVPLRPGRPVVSRDGRSGGGGRGRTARGRSVMAAPRVASRPVATDPGT